MAMMWRRASAVELADLSVKGMMEIKLEKSSTVTKI
jgi:hypothetical protein